MQRDPDNNQRDGCMSTDGSYDDFASAMQDVHPLSTGKQTFAPPQRPRPDDAEARRRAAEEFQSEKDASNFLTLGAVKARDSLEVLAWRQDGLQLAVLDKLG